MTDVVDRDTRSRIMASIRGKDTKPELTLRRALHAQGLRYRLHDRNLPGTPDLIFRRFGAVCFVHGCFWHHHQGCPFATVPTTRVDYWQEKLKKNCERDSQALVDLLNGGWRVAVVWECALRKNGAGPISQALVQWLRSDARRFETTLEWAKQD